jgi:hypothetical protein
MMVMGRGDARERQQEQGRPSFLKKRSKKLFPFCRVPLANDRAPTGKSFLLLFFKKEGLP